MPSGADPIRTQTQRHWRMDHRPRDGIRLRSFLTRTLAVVGGSTFRVARSILTASPNSLPGGGLSLVRAMVPIIARWPHGDVFLGTVVNRNGDRPVCATSTSPDPTGRGAPCWPC